MWYVESYPPLKWIQSLSGEVWLQRKIKANSSLPLTV